MADSFFPKVKKSITDFLYEEEGNIPRNKLLTLGSMILLLSILYADEAFAGHRSHSSHSSHGSHGSSSHGSSHGSHSSHESHSSHQSVSHSSHGSTDFAGYAEADCETDCYPQTYGETDCYPQTYGETDCYPQAYGKTDCYSPPHFAAQQQCRHAYNRSHFCWILRHSNAADSTGQYFCKLHQ